MSGYSEDFAKIAAEVSTKILEDLAGKFSGGLSMGVKKVKWLSHSGFKSYIQQILKKVALIKIIINPSEKILLDRIYVPLNFKSPKGDVVSDVDVINSFTIRERIIVTGTAGGGKSVFLRYVTMEMIKNYHEKKILPIFYELRNLNVGKNSTIIEAVFDTVAFHIPAMSSSDFNHAVQTGQFALILDGFDEVDHDKRDTYLREITDLCNNYPLMRIIMTSRPDHSIFSLEAFLYSLFNK